MIGQVLERVKIMNFEFRLNREVFMAWGVKSRSELNLITVIFKSIDEFQFVVSHFDSDSADVYANLLYLIFITVFKKENNTQNCDQSSGSVSALEWLVNCRKYNVQ